MVDKIVVGFIIACLVIMMAVFIIVILTLAADCVIDEIIEIKKKIEEGFGDE